jgi:dCMP deaminase
MKHLLNRRELDFYMDVASRTSLMSRCERLKVGAVIVKKDNIISFSWNGTSPGDDNCCEYEEDGVLVTKPEVIHAEEHAILKLAKQGCSGKKSILICTHAPCISCARMIHNVGIKTVYYKDIYKNDRGIIFLIDHKVNVLRHQI